MLASDTGDMDHIEDALDAIDRLDELRTDLVDMLRTREIVGDREQIDVGTLAERAWERINTPNGVSLEIVDRPEMAADPDATKRLLQNLLSNSIEHSDGDTTVRVGTLSDGFYIEDDGPGIAPENRDTVFEPGYTTKSGGTGMGMASVKQIVDEHDWEITITDAEMLDGARFEITS
jgi:signal transduction histidine kinase